MTSSGLPPLRPAPEPVPLTVRDEILPSGARVLAVRRANVGMVEVRLQIPFQGAAPTHAAQAEVLTAALLAGTARRDRDDLAAAVQALGGTLHAGVDADRLTVSGSALASALPDLLDILGEVLGEASYPDTEVDQERQRLVQRLEMARSQASVVAREALSRRLWADHPYTRDMPEASDVARVTADQTRALHALRVRPGAATLVLVGDVDLDTVPDLAESRLARWTAADCEPAAGASADAVIDPLPVPVPGPPLLIERPGSVQSSLRLATAAVPREHPDAPALALANLVFGGYFSSRWVANIREDKGYTYSPRSGIEHRVLGSTFVASADVASEVTAAALLETQYELGRIATTGVTGIELEDARQYAIGSLALSTATQAGLASTLSALAAAGLGPEYLQAQPGRLAAVDVEQAGAAAARYLAPARMVAVIVGDADQIAAPLRLITELADD